MKFATSLFVSLPRGLKHFLGRDYQQTLEMQKLLRNEIGSFDAILLFWKGTETR